MNRNQDHLIRGHYEVAILLRNIVAHYDTYGSTVSDADLRSLNYAARRLNERAIREGIPAALLHYPKQ